MAKQTKKVEFIVDVDFEWQGKQYKARSEFDPGDMQHDPTFEQFRNISGRQVGVAFIYQVQRGTTRNAEGKTVPNMDTRRVILPLIEKGGTSGE